MQLEAKLLLNELPRSDCALRSLSKNISTIGSPCLLDKGGQELYSLMNQVIKILRVFQLHVMMGNASLVALVDEDT